MSVTSNILAKRPFGRTGLMVSPITFGAWSIGGPAEMGGKQIGWTGVSDDESIDALSAASDAGINLFDTADAYGRGHSERLLGRAFAGAMRDKVLISSKAGMVDNPDGFKLDFSRDHLTRACEGSLRRLGTDRLDVYLLHMVTDGHALTDDIRDTLHDLRLAGKVRHYGVSVQFPHQGMEQLDQRFGDAMMIEYSPLKRAGVEDVLVRAHNVGVGVITRGALEKGLLTGKYAPGHRFDARDVRSRIPPEQIDRVTAGVAELKEQAASEGWSLVGMAMAFQLAQPGCSTVTVGLKTRGQVEELVAALGERHGYDWDRIVTTLEGTAVRGVIDDIDILDGHVHCYHTHHLERLVADIRYTGARQFCALVTDRMEGVDSARQWENALWLKHTYPRDAFIFGGLDIHSIVEEGRAEPDVPFGQQLLDLMAAGCDGLKLLIGKPDRRKALRFPLDSPVLEPMLSLAEQTRFPVLWHVGDPPEFWSEHTVPLWAQQRGWWYDDTHPPKAQIEAEIARVFERHPTLNLILPHFFFLSDRLDDAARLLETYPTYALDLAPGVELYHNLTARHAAARDFFVRYADRIIFGTDFGLPCGWSRDRGMMIRRFLETDEVFVVPDDPAMQPDDRPPLRGLALPRDVLVKIYGENFRRRVGATPRPLAESQKTQAQSMS